MSACLLARAKLAQFVSSLAESSSAEKAGTVIKAGYLGSMKGLERNLGSNFAFGIALEDLGVQPLALAADVLQAHVRSAVTFGKVAPHELRTMASSLDVGGMKAVAKGVREGTAEAVQLLRTGVDASNIGSKFDLHTVTFDNPVVNTVVHGVFNVLEASDKPFFGYAFQRSLYQRAKLMGIRAGYTGAKLAGETDRWMKSPSEGMMLGALEDAQYATYKNRTPLGEFAAGARARISQRAEQAPPGQRLGYQAAGLALDITLPFTKVGSAIVNATADLTPGVAVLKAALSTAFDRSPTAIGVVPKALARSTIGTGLALAGATLMRKGLVSTDAATPAERAQWEAGGKTPFSIKVNGRWRSVLWLGPMAPVFMMGAFLEQTRQKKAAGGTPMSSTEEGLAAGAFMAKTLSQASYLQSVRDLVGALQSGELAASSLASAFVPTPSMTSQVRTIIDPLKRDASTLSERAANATPGLSRTLPAKRDVTGATVPRRAPGLTGILETLLDPTNPSTDRSTPALRELDRLQVNIGRPSSVVRVGNRVQTRSTADRSGLIAEYGPELLVALEVAVADPDYRALTDEEKVKALRHIIRAHKGEAADTDRNRRAQALEKVGAAGAGPRVRVPQR
jgi:hypothetical protein